MASLGRIAVIAWVTVVAAGCPLDCPRLEKTVALPEATSMGPDGGGSVADGGYTQAVARCRASADDCLAFCMQAASGSIKGCRRLTTDAGYELQIVSVVPCL